MWPVCRAHAIQRALLQFVTGQLRTSKPQQAPPAMRLSFNEGNDTASCICATDRSARWLEFDDACLEIQKHESLTQSHERAMRLTSHERSRPSPSPVHDRVDSCHAASGQVLVGGGQTAERGLHRSCRGRIRPVHTHESMTELSTLNLACCTCLPGSSRSALPLGTHSRIAVGNRVAPVPPHRSGRAR